MNTVSISELKCPCANDDSPIINKKARTFSFKSNANEIPEPSRPPATGCPTILPNMILGMVKSHETIGNSRLRSSLKTGHSLAALVGQSDGEPFAGSTLEATLFGAFFRSTPYSYIGGQRGSMDHPWGSPATIKSDAESERRRLLLEMYGSSLISAAIELVRTNCVGQTFDCRSVQHLIGVNR